MPAPVPPPREWQSWKPWRQSQPAQIHGPHVAEVRCERCYFILSVTTYLKVKRAVLLKPQPTRNPMLPS